MAVQATARRQFQALFEVIAAKVTVDMGAALADGVGVSVDVNIAGAALGDFVLVAAPTNIAGGLIQAYVKSAGVVTVRFQNETGAGSYDIAAGAFNFIVLKPSSHYFK